MRVMIAGATGFIGSHIVHTLAGRGWEVLAGVRHPQSALRRFPSIEVFPLDFNAPCDAASLQAALQGVDLVVNAVGIISETRSQTFRQLHEEFPRCLFRACEQAGVGRVVQISALGAGVDSISAYHRSKHAADAFLSELALSSQSLEAVIIKPAFVYGRGGGSTEFFRALAAQPWQILVAGGGQQVQPVHIDDVCELVARLAEADVLPLQEIEAVGPAPMSFRQMLAAYRQWLGYGEFRPLSVPYRLTMGMARLAAPFNAMLTPENIGMLQQDNKGDAAPITAVLGRPPRALETALLQSPATEPERWHARLFFLLPLLRLVIGLVWVFTGIVSAFVYPAEDSYAMLAQVGFTGALAVLALYGAAALDIVLGIAVWLRYRVILTGLLQLAVIFSYTALITLFLPEYWLHPFGPILKNIPFVVAIMIMMAVEKR